MKVSATATHGCVTVVRLGDTQAEITLGGVEMQTDRMGRILSEHEILDLIEALTKIRTWICGDRMRAAEGRQ